MCHAFSLRLALYWDTKTDGTSCVQVHFQKLQIAWGTGRLRQAQRIKVGTVGCWLLLIAGWWHSSQVHALFPSSILFVRSMVFFDAADLFSHGSTLCFIVLSFEVGTDTMDCITTACNSVKRFSRLMYVPRCGSSVLPVCRDSWLPEVFACMIWWQWCPDCASNWPELTVWPEKGVVTRRNSVQRSQRDFSTFASSFTPPLYAGGKAASSWLYPWLREGSDAKRSSTVTSHADLTRLTNLRLQAVHGPELCTWGMVKTSKPLSSRWQRIQARSPKKSGIKMALKS